MAHIRISVRVVGVLLALAPLAAATDPALLELIMPDARIVVGMDFTRLRTSPMGEALRTGIQTGMRQADGAGDLQKLLGQLPFDPLQDIQEILFASTGAGKNPPALVIVRGNARLRALIESPGIHTKTGANALVMVGDLLVTGDAAQVNQLLRRVDAQLEERDQALPAREGACGAAGDA